MSIVAAFMVPHPPMILPQVGQGRERQISKTIHAYEQVAREIGALEPDTIVISSPHTVMYMDYFHISPGRSAKGSFASFGAPGASFEERYDTKLAGRIAELAEEKGFPAGFLGEREPALDHGTMVPLYFIRKYCSDFQIVRVGLSGLPLTDHYTLGQLIQQAAEETGRRTVYVASGDLSHKLQAHGPYGYAPEGPVYDERVMEACSRGDFGALFHFDESFCEKAAECGHRSFVIMAGALDGRAVEAKSLSHEDVTGVGYGICSFRPGESREERRFLDRYLEEREAELLRRKEGADPYVQLARETLERYILERERPSLPEDLPREMREIRAGAFVSIHKLGKLRGCIGTISPTADCLAREIANNAVSAATRDPRFPPITPEELKWLEINVDVLGEPEDIDSPDQLDVKRYGVIVSRGAKRGLLLPDLDGVDTVEQQIDIARQKAGIAPGVPVTLQRFEVTRHV